MMKKFMQGRFLVTSLVRNFSRCRHPPPRLEVDVFGRPMRVLEAIERMEKLHDSEKIKYGYLFSELLGLPNPPNISTEQGVERNKCAVKLVKFDANQRASVLREIAWAKWNEEPRSLKDIEFESSIDLMDNVPSVIKQGVTKKEAKEIIAKIEAAGGEADMVMESLE